ncbi:hypothetical protein BBEV_3073 [Salisediminibacterium beveridgei]|uniref:YokE-like PH domain-containing protein n=2 Tax=Salisediminibacterium beveridgei TaxID=632773 RepID=A0A1D7QZK3_9BACI|nr:hypothetical protein BBEV_3073 [Salisediminibacterium beveridgei]
MIFPDRVELSNSAVLVTKKKFFGLTSTSEEVSYKRIASVRLNKGLISGNVVIETAGGSVNDIEVKGFKKKVASKLQARLKESISKE